MNPSNTVHGTTPTANKRKFNAKDSDGAITQAGPFPTMQDNNYLEDGVGALAEQAPHPLLPYETLAPAKGSGPTLQASFKLPLRKKPRYSSENVKPDLGSDRDLKKLREWALPSAKKPDDPALTTPVNLAGIARPHWLHLRPFGEKPVYSKNAELVFLHGTPSPKPCARCIEKKVLCMVWGQRSRCLYCTNRSAPGCGAAGTLQSA